MRKPIPTPHGTARFRLIDAYLLRLLAWPIVGCLGVTVIALLLERVLRLLDVLSQSSARFGYVTSLAANLVPHYLGLALPVAFFVALFIVITKLSDGSEIDALLASGQSLTRIAAPFVCVGLFLTVFSLVVFGYMQPYSRYAYRAVMHEAINAGWNGKLNGGAFIDQPKLLMTADGADAAGQQLTRVFIRRMDVNGREEVITAATADLRADADGKNVTMLLRKGQRIGVDALGHYRILMFDRFTTNVPLAGAAALLRSRGGDERELTLGELARQADSPKPIVPRATLLAELYGRLARALFLPFLPLLAFPLGLAAKRGNRTPGLIIAGVLLLAFQHSLQLGQSLAESGKAMPLAAVGAPWLIFTGLSVWMFIGSRKRPGQTPVTELIRRFGVGIKRFRRMFRDKFEQAEA
ncbi:permease [Caulobacter sp. Root1455]|uniref:LptF/LptG family permease n=1 Tax=unclassified Caulobacter TaxID=2648921 RepID=UPI0006F4E66E|nr:MULTISPECIES: LptF/LptG family permease [unclassified Caulobacter]KQY30199.1 permease [Caulobacter sp. Root487D2Y]KQY92497.1 permease [Caulobacter sp. Root1455]